MGKPETSLLQYDGWLSGGAAMVARFSPPWNSCKKLDACEHTGTFFSPELAAAFSKDTHAAFQQGPVAGRVLPGFHPGPASLGSCFLRRESQGPGEPCQDRKPESQSIHKTGEKSCFSAPPGPGETKCQQSARGMCPPVCPWQTNPGRRRHTNKAQVFLLPKL